MGLTSLEGQGAKQNARDAFACQKSQLQAKSKGGSKRPSSRAEGFVALSHTVEPVGNAAVALSVFPGSLRAKRWVPYIHKSS